MSHRFSTNSIFFFSRQCYLTIRQKPHHVLKQTVWNRLHLGKKLFLRLSRNSPHFMQPKVYYLIYNSSPLLHILVHKNSVHFFFLQSSLTSHFHLRLGLPSGLFASGFPVNNVHGFSPSAIPPTRPTLSYPPLPDHQIMSDEQYK